jgi:iron complex transport system substrate-binding protein
MKNLWLIFAGLLCWTAAGFLAQDRQDRPAEGPPARPARIVSTAPNLTEILFALGLKDRIAAVTTDSNYPPAAAEKPKIGNFWQVDIEAVISTGPDLAVTLGFDRQADLARRLQRAGYNTLTVDIETIEQLYEGIERIGAATASTAAAAELLREMKTRIGRFSGGGRRRSRVLWVIQRKPMRVAGRETFINEMIELAGGTNAVASTIHKYPPIGAEQLVGSAPDVIIETADRGADAFRQRAEALKFYGRFTNIPAVTHERIHVILADTVSRLGPRLCEGIEAIAGCLEGGGAKR